MPTNNPIAVCDTNQERAEMLTALLVCLGETAKYIPPAEMALSLAQEEFSFMILGDAEPQVLKKIDEQIEQPIAMWFIGREPKSMSEFPGLQQYALGCIMEPFYYIDVLDAIHQCQLFNERFASANENAESLKSMRSLVGSTAPIKQIRQLVHKVAVTDANVLILGESGTGKEVVAQNLHTQSKRAEFPFVPVNCGAIPGELLESELFGHEKGAFTGAITARQGRIELAQGGTLFLDEIGDMPLAMQVKLLRFLQERTFERVGSNKSLKADVRIIAATHQDLEKLIEVGEFREDLYYRLNVFPIHMPSLRDRISDLPLIVNELLTRSDREANGTIRLLPNAMNALCQYNWPGNIRELGNLLERLVILHPNKIVDYQDLPEKFKCGEQQADIMTEERELNPDSIKELTELSQSGLDLKQHLINTELSLIKIALEESNGVVAKAANYLNMRRTTLVEKMKKYGLNRQNWSESIDKNMTL